MQLFKSIFAFTGHIILMSILVVLLLPTSSCKKNSDTTIPEDTSLLIVLKDSLDPQIADDYSNISGIGMSSLWGSYNLHDPSIIKHGEYYYIYSTDVAYGPNGRCGIMQRKSLNILRNLVILLLLNVAKVILSILQF